ncbi:FaeA-like protein [Escherichia coli]|uniref:FaeA/PapI family transcriptional regulator n=1 Tax=Escherichia coli TaxID=562 RepID=UPI001918935D|nr:FaeA/PapI family transcriptional regulator [Escherichia coli]EIX4635353.1 faeA-like family protein [Escherichia coli]CAD5757474.1 FaeA-like protein [Escherichia coli]CAD6109890.1 FaeA-like protein [Escherichia coli]CAD6554592.1 FaeA-like protein [Escherichia coli]
MNRDIEKLIINFMEQQKNSVNRTFLSTREIADAVGLTIYQVRGYLEALQSSFVVEKVNYGRGSPGQWRLL